MIIDTRSVAAAADCMFRGKWLAKHPPIGFDSNYRRFPLAVISTFREVLVRELDKDASYEDQGITLPLTKWDKDTPDAETLELQLDLWQKALEGTAPMEHIRNGDFQVTLKSEGAGASCTLDWLDKEAKTAVLLRVSKQDPAPRARLDMALIADIVEDNFGFRPDFYLLWVKRLYPSASDEARFPMARRYPAPPSNAACDLGIYELINELQHEKDPRANPNSNNCKFCPCKQSCPVYGDNAVASFTHTTIINPNRREDNEG